MRMPQRIIGVATALALAGAAAADHKITLRRADDKATVTAGPDRAVIVIQSTTGIGSLEIAPRDADWPSAVALRLRYASGKPFGNLENLVVGTPHVLASGRINAENRMAFAFRGAAAPPHGAEESERTTGGQLRVKFVRTVAGLEVTLPPHLLTGRQPLTVAWIDAYR